MLKKVMSGASVIENVKLKIIHARLEIKGLIILCTLNENVFSRNHFMNISSIVI